jgi:hypothetical protein
MADVRTIGSGPSKVMCLPGWFGSSTGWGHWPELLDQDLAYVMDRVRRPPVVPALELPARRQAAPDLLANGLQPSSSRFVTRGIRNGVATPATATRPARPSCSSRSGSCPWDGRR